MDEEVLRLVGQNRAWQLREFTMADLEKAETALLPATRQRLEKAFAQKITPEQLAGDLPAQAMVIAGHTGSLAEFLRLDAWAQNVGEVAKYEAALESLPEDFRDTFSTQLAVCKDALTGRRTQLNRDGSAPQGDFRKRLGIGKNAQPHAKDRMTIHPQERTL